MVNFPRSCGQRGALEAISSPPVRHSKMAKRTIWSFFLVKVVRMVHQTAPVAICGVMHNTTYILETHP